MDGTMNSEKAIRELEARRRALVEQLLDVRSLVRGSLTEQYLKVPQVGSEEPAVRGPYYVLSRSERGRTKSERVRKDEVKRVKHDVANYKRFTALCEELTQVTEHLGGVERQAAASEETQKKKPTLRSNKARKSSG